MQAQLKGLALAILALGMFASGGSAAVTHSMFYDFRYYPNEVSVSGAPLPVEVRGAPESVDPEEFATSIRLPNHVRRKPVLAKPGETGPRLVIGFAAASGPSLCRADGGPTSAATALTLAGAYCVGDIPYSSGITKGGGGSLAGAAKDLARVLLPKFNPEHRRRLNSRD